MSTSNIRSPGDFEFNDESWAERMIDMPTGMPKSASSASEAMRIPGCCLKSKETRHQRTRRFTARLLTLDDAADLVTVLSHSITFGTPRYTWTGTVSTYLSTWDCD